MVSMREELNLKFYYILTSTILNLNSHTHLVSTVSNKKIIEKNKYCAFTITQKSVTKKC